MPKNLIDKLRTFNLFSEVSDSDLKELSTYVSILSRKRHENIWTDGDKSRFLYLITTGRVKIIKHSETGKDVIIDVFGPGDAIGETGLFVHYNYSTTAVCLAPVDMLIVPRKKILELLEKVPPMAFRAMRGMAKRQLMLMQKIKELTAGGVEYRIAHLLLKLADRTGESRAGISIIPMVLSRQDIADLVGTTVETTIRVMSRWKKMKIVNSDKTGISIIDRETLESLIAGITTRV